MANNAPRRPPNPYRRLKLSAQKRREAYDRLLQCHTKLSPEEAELLGAVFGDIFDAHYTAVWNRLRRRCRLLEDAQDLAQETFATLYSYLLAHGFRNDLRRTSLAITRGILLNYLRGRRRSPISLGLPTSSAERPHSLGAVERAAVAMAVLRRVLEQLSPDEIEVLDLVILSDLTFAEAAKVLEIPAGTVKTRARAVRLTIVAALKEVGAEGAKGSSSAGSVA